MTMMNRGASKAAEVVTAHLMQNFKPFWGVHGVLIVSGIVSAGVEIPTQVIQ